MIRLPDIPSLQGTAINAPQVRAGAVAAPAAALGAVADTIGKVSDHFTGTAQRLQKIENARMISEKQLELQSAYAAHQVELQSDPDPISRMKRTEAFLANAQGLMDPADAPPAVREVLMGQYNEFAGRAKINQAEDSAKLTVRRAGLAFQNQYDAALNAGDRVGMESALNNAQESGAMLPEEADAARTKFDQETAYRAEQSAIATNPIERERMLQDPEYVKKNPNLTPEAHQALQRQAEQAANQYRADFTNQMIITGVTPTLEELAEMEATGTIDKSTHARLASKIRAEAVPKFDPAIYEETYGQIMAYDPAKDQSGRVEAQLRSWIGSQPLPDESVKELNERLTKRLSATESKKPKSVHESAFASKIAVDFNRGDWGKFRFPIDHDKNPATAPIMRVTREEYDKAWTQRGEFTDQWRAILESLPEDATFDQVNSQYEALKKSYKDKKPLPDLKFSKPTPAPFNPDALYESTKPQGAFGGVPIQAPGVPYKGAAATVFGGPNDPADNGMSALGGKTGPGGREGTAIPQDLLKSKFPGKDKKWIDSNVRTVVKDPAGVLHTLAVADFGTAEWVWQRNGRPTLDLTEGAAKQLGGQVVYRNGKLADVKGLNNLDFAVVSIDTGAPLAGQSWEEAKTAWFQVNKPRSYEAASMSLIALRDAWNKATLENQVLRPGEEAKLSQPVLRPGDEGELIDANTRIAAGNY